MSTRTQRDIVFAHARIGYNKGHGSMQVVALKLDFYLPAVPARTPSPALVLLTAAFFIEGRRKATSSPTAPVLQRQSPSIAAA